MAEPDDLEVFGSAPVQAVGAVEGRDFYFRSRHDEWSVEVANASGGMPSDGYPGGFYRSGFAKDASYLPRSRVLHLINRATDEYVRLRHQLPAAYFDTGLTPQLRSALSVEDALLLALALRAPLDIARAVALVGYPTTHVENGLETLTETDEARCLKRGSAVFWLLRETYMWLGFNE